MKLYRISIIGLIAFALLSIVGFLLPQQTQAQSADGSGVDLVFLVENRDDSRVRNQDFGELDPEGVRYDAMRFAASYLIEDSLTFNVDAQHTVTMIRFDDDIDTGSDSEGVTVDPILIDANNASTAEALNDAFNSALQLPGEETSCGSDALRCGANFSSALQTASTILAEQGNSQRTQIVIILTVDGCGADTTGCSDQSHNAQMTQLDDTVSEMIQNGIRIHLLPIYGSEQENFDNATFQETRNRTWALISENEWRDFERRYDNFLVEVLPRPQDYVTALRNILQDNLPLNIGNVQTLEPRAVLELDITPYTRAFQLIYYKVNASDSINLSYSNPNDPGYVLDIERTDGNFFEVLTVTNPPPGNFWSVETPSERGEITLVQLPSNSVLRLQDISSRQTINEINMYHEFDIIYSPIGSNGQLLTYGDQNFDLSPMAIIENINSGKIWSVPLSLNREGGDLNGQYEGRFYAVEPGQHRVSISSVTNRLDVSLLEASNESTFDAMLVNYDIVGTNGTTSQFIDWDYQIVFRDEAGDTISEEDFAILPSILSYSIEYNDTTVPGNIPTYNAQSGAFEATKTFVNHGTFVFTSVLTIEDVDGNDITIAGSSDSFNIDVAPAPTAIDLEFTTVSEYQEFDIDFNVVGIDSGYLQRTFGLEFVALVEIQDTEGASELIARIPLALNADGNLQASYYAVSEGAYTVSVEAFIQNAAARNVAINAEQTVANLTVNAVTVNLLSGLETRQFDSYEFTLGLQRGGQAYTTELADGASPEISIQFGDTFIPANQLTPHPTNPNQWIGSVIFTEFGNDLPITISGRVTPAGTNSSDDTTVLIDLAEDLALKTLDVEATNVQFFVNQREILVADQITFDVNMPEVTNQVLRNDYGAQIEFVLSVRDSNDIIQTWTLSALDTDDPNAPFSQSFIPPIPGNYSITPVLSGDDPNLEVSLAGLNLNVSVRPLTLSMFIDESDVWDRYSNGTTVVEIERPISLTVQFYDGDPDADNVISTRDPLLPVTIQARLFAPGVEAGEELAITRIEDTLQYNMNAGPYGVQGSYRIELIGEVTGEDGRTFALPVNRDIADGLSFEVIPIQQVTMRLSSDAVRTQFATGIAPFQSNIVTLDVETYLQDDSGQLTAVSPDFLFNNPDVVMKPEWFIVSLDEEVVDPQMVTISYPPELTAPGFRIQLEGVGISTYQLGVDINPELDPVFGVRRTSISLLSGEEIFLTQNPLQIIIPAVIMLMLIAFAIFLLIRKRNFESNYAIQSGMLVLQDEIGRHIWEKPLTDAKQATQSYNKTDANVRGFGRAMIDKITVKNSPATQANNEVDVIVEQQGKAQEVTIKLDNSREPVQLTGAGGGFYITVEPFEGGEE